MGPNGCGFLIQRSDARSWVRCLVWMVQLDPKEHGNWKCRLNRYGGGLKLTELFKVVFKVIVKMLKLQILPIDDAKCYTISSAAFCMVVRNSDTVRGLRTQYSLDSFTSSPFTPFRLTFSVFFISFNTYITCSVMCHTRTVMHH